eukprot:m.8641 g.8641  ORF g.8641 m.8641 type:complete len:309 (-) comp3202_c0_seq2:83-1009(-)
MSEEECKELQLEELESLESLYEDEFKWLTKDPAVFMKTGNHTCAIAVSDNFDLGLLLPKDYPLVSCPIFQIDTRWSNRDEDALRISSMLKDSFEPGFGVIAEWVESLRELLAAIEEERKKESKQQEEEELSRELAREFSSQDCMNETEELMKDLDVRTDEVDAMEIFSDAPFTDRKSTFQGHVAEVNSHDDVKMMVAQLLRNSKIVKATHNMLAYRIKDDATGSYMQDCDDDGEHGASSRMLHLLNVLGVENVAVVVSRWYGGIQLGPDRFKHINNCTRDALVNFGFHSDDSGDNAMKKKKKGGRKGK